MKDELKTFIQSLKDLFTSVDPDSKEDLQRLAAELIWEHGTDENLVDLVDCMIKAELYNSWDDFYEKFFTYDSTRYEENIEARPVLGGYDLNPVKAMYEHFRSSAFTKGASAEAKKEYLARHNDANPIMPSVRNAASIKHYDVFGKFLNQNASLILLDFQKYCKQVGIDEFDFIEYFGIRHLSTQPKPSTTQPAAQPTTTPTTANNSSKNYSSIISAIKFKTPGKTEYGLSSLAFKDTLTLTPFRYKQLFQSNLVIKRELQKAVGSAVHIAACFSSLTDPDLLLIATPGYNFLTTKDQLILDVKGHYLVSLKGRI